MNRHALSAEKPYLQIEECEPDGAGGQAATVTIFLTASECPIGCHMCDLWKNTLPHATPAGAIPKQIDVALRGRSRSGWIKLYNSGNFFDRRSIPPQDYDAIAARCSGFARVVVENHPRFGADHLLRFRDLLAAPLEVAVGLETVQPRWLDRMGKRFTRDDFDRYAGWLRDQGVDLRVFLIVGVPGSSVAESIRWARLSTRHAIARGARHVSLIPARIGHGWNGRAGQLPKLSVEPLLELQSAVLRDADRRAAITVDLWDLDSPAGSNDARLVDQLRRINLSQQSSPADPS